MPRSWASVATPSPRIAPGPPPWAACPTPSCPTSIPRERQPKSYDLYNEERGGGNRAVIIVDRDGVIRYRETYEPGVLPDPEKILAALADIN